MRKQYSSNIFPLVLLLYYSRSALLNLFTDSNRIRSFRWILSFSPCLEVRSLLAILRQRPTIASSPTTKPCEQHSFTRCVAAEAPSHIAPPTAAQMLQAESQKECRMKIPSTNNYTVHCCCCCCSSLGCCPVEAPVSKLDNAICTLLHMMDEVEDDPEAPPSLDREKYYSAACTFFSC